jgi:hypothetical protein
MRLSRVDAASRVDVDMRLDLPMALLVLMMSIQMP